MDYIIAMIAILIIGNLLIKTWVNYKEQKRFDKLIEDMDASHAEVREKKEGPEIINELLVAEYIDYGDKGE